MNRKKILILVVLILILFLIFIFWPSKNKGTGTNTATSTTKTISQSAQITSGPAVINGWLRCLPSLKANTNCLIGLEDAGGKDYGLVDQFGNKFDVAQFTSGSRFSVNGDYIFTPDFLKDYNIVGTIQAK